MARNALIVTATDEVIAHGFCAFTPEAGEAVVTVPDNFTIDPRTERFDAGAPMKKRPATPAEQVAYDAQQEDLEATLAWDSPAGKALQALAVTMFDEIDGRHAASPVNRAAARQRFIDKFKAL